MVFQFRAIGAEMHAQLVCVVYDIRQPPTSLCTTSNFLNPHGRHGHHCRHGNDGHGDNCGHGGHVGHGGRGEHDGQDRTGKNDI